LELRHSFMEGQGERYGIHQIDESHISYHHEPRPPPPWGASPPCPLPPPPFAACWQTHFIHPTLQPCEMRPPTSCPTLHHPPKCLLALYPTLRHKFLSLSQR
jgi:hypothetical protein